MLLVPRTPTACCCTEQTGEPFRLSCHRQAARDIVFCARLCAISEHSLAAACTFQPFSAHPNTMECMSTCARPVMRCIALPCRGIPWDVLVIFVTGATVPKHAETHFATQEKLCRPRQPQSSRLMRYQSQSRINKYREFSLVCDSAGYLAEYALPFGFRVNMRTHLDATRTK